jgi:hypothetical protein
MCHALAHQQKCGTTVLLTENRRQHVVDTDFVPAAVLYVEHGALQHAPESGLWLHFALIIRRPLQSVGLDVLSKVGSELIKIRAAALEYLAYLRGIEDSQQQMLDGEEFMVRAARLAKGLIEARLQFAR